VGTNSTSTPISARQLLGDIHLEADQVPVLVLEGPGHENIQSHLQDAALQNLIHLTLRLFGGASTRRAGAARQQSGEQHDDGHNPCNFPQTTYVPHVSLLDKIKPRIDTNLHESKT
jgi:hypothetical protein